MGASGGVGLDSSTMVAFLVALLAVGLVLLWRSLGARNALTRCVCVEQLRGTTSPASHPLDVSLSLNKLRVLSPELFQMKPAMDCPCCNGRHFPRVMLEVVGIQLSMGDSQPALVVESNPLRVAAYSDEFDAIVIVALPVLPGLPRFAPGDRLIAINTYGPRADRATEYAPDLSPGEGWSRAWWTFAPHVAEFYTDDLELLDERKREIPEELWARVAELVRNHRPTHADRDGRPLRPHHPGLSTAVC